MSWSSVRGAGARPSMGGLVIRGGGADTPLHSMIQFFFQSKYFMRVSVQCLKNIENKKQHSKANFFVVKRCISIRRIFLTICYSTRLVFAFILICKKQENNLLTVNVRPLACK